MKARLKHRLATEATASPSADGVKARECGISTPHPPARLPSFCASSGRCAPRPAARVGAASSNEAASTIVTREHFDSRTRYLESRPPEAVAVAATVAVDPPAARQAATLPVSSAPRTWWLLAALTTFDLSALKERAERMLLGDGEQPVVSGIAAVAGEATIGLVVAVRGVVETLWAARQDGIKAACAPTLIDEVDVLAYLIADALGRPLLSRAYTNDVGRRVHSCAARVRSEKLPKAREQARTAARAAARKGAPADAARAVADAEAAIFALPYPGLDLPKVAGGKRKERERCVDCTAAHLEQVANAADAAADAATAAMDAAVAARDLAMRRGSKALAALEATQTPRAREHAYKLLRRRKDALESACAAVAVATEHDEAAAKASAAAMQKAALAAAEAADAAKAAVASVDQESEELLLRRWLCADCAAVYIEAARRENGAV
jgi:hypothetical protein